MALDPLAANPAGTQTAIDTMNQQINNPGLPPGTDVNPALLSDDPSLVQGAPQLNPASPLTGGPTTPEAATTNAPSAINPTSYDATQVGNQTPTMDAAKGTVDPRSIATAAQAEVDPRATVQGQLKSLWEDPNQTWAQGAVRGANEAMAARGMGASTMAGEAITNAAMEAALPIAQADAQIYAAYGLANLNNRQAAALQNAQTYAQMNLANLTNEQQARLTNQQARLTTMLSDQAAENAAKNFSAANQSQTDQFMAQLAQNAAQFNAGQINAMNQFSAGETNSWAKFQAEQVSAREQFNVNMAAQIEAANFAWRRQLNTANTAAINAANQTNAQNRLNLSNYALDKIWQEFRDEANWAFTRSENEQTRAGNLAMAAFQNSSYKDMLSEAQRNEFASMLGRVSVAFLSAL